MQYCHHTSLLALVLPIVLACSPTSQPTSSSTADGDKNDTNNQPLDVAPRDWMRLGSDAYSYFDPEILSDPPLLTFTDSERNVWLANLDPLTGQFTSANGTDTLIDIGHADLLTTKNGPEFAVDRHGWSVVYSKDQDGAIQIWRAQLTEGVVQTSSVTSGTQTLGPVASKNADAESTRVLTVRGSWIQGDAVWIDLDAPDVIHPFSAVDTDTDGRWIDGTNQFIHTLVESPYIGQLAIYDTDTGETRVITDDEGIKTRPYGWSAPEADGALRVLALVDDTTIGVYQATDSGTWQRIMTVQIPTASNATRFSSPEPFVASQRSWASATLINDKTNPPDSQIWILDLGSDKGIGSFRCDDGETAPARRADPEIFSGSQQMFVFYYEYDPLGPVSLNRCATGIRSTGSCACLNEGYCLNDGTCSCPEGYTGSLCEAPDQTLDFEAAATYSALHGGGAMIVSIGDDIVFEHYDNDQSASTYFPTASGGKSFWGVATLAMIDRGELASTSDLEEPASALLTQWEGTQKDQIRLWQLPYLVSGLTTCRECYSSYWDPIAQVRVSDTFDYAVNTETLQELPGTYFEYGAVNHFIWGAIMEQLTGEDPRTYFTNTVMTPLGMSVFHWPQDDTGNPRMHGGYYLTARDYLKFGQLVANRGRMDDGTQLIEEQLFDLLWQRRGPNPGHAMFFWQNDPAGHGVYGEMSPTDSAGGFLYHDGYPEMIAAVGSGPEILAIFPKQKMVVLRQILCNTPETFPCEDPTDFDWHLFFSALFGK